MSFLKLLLDDLAPQERAQAEATAAANLAELRWGAFEERAAIMEYDGGLSRPAAEASAAECVRRMCEAWGLPW